MTDNELDNELEDRELASRLLAEFTTYTKEDYEMIATQAWEKIHPKIIEKLEAVERWEIKRLMIFVRPRIWKSELASIRFPTWCLGKKSERKIVISSYGADLASDFWRKAKQVVESQEFNNIFPGFALAKDKREWGNWETSKGWWVYTVWVWWALTGKWFDIWIIDDPVKDREEAESAVYQQKVINWYTSTFYTRKQSQDSAIILMMTRWNQRDLAWYLLKEAKNGWDQWDVLVIPAIDEQWHEIIWPGKWDKWYITNEKANVSKRDWAALYQQDPIWSSSNIFELKNLRYFLMSDFEKEWSILKKTYFNVWIYVDPAFSSSKNSDDASVMWFWKHKISNDIYWFDYYSDVWAPSKTFHATLAMYDSMVMEWLKPKYICIEDVPLNKNQTKFIQDFKLFLKDNNRLDILIITHKPKGKKEDRIKFVLEPITAMHALYLRKDFPDKSIIQKIEDQLVEFPNGKHDDTIDCITMAATDLNKKRIEEAQQNKPRTFHNKMSGSMQRWGNPVGNRFWL